MLQEKKKYSAGCVRFAIFLGVVVFLIISGLFIFLIFIIFAFIGGNKKNKVNLNKILGFIGIYDCVKYFFGDFEKLEDNGLNKGRKINSYLEKMNNSIKKRALELKRKEELERKNELNDYTEVLEDIELSKKSKELDKDNSLKANGNYNSNKYNSFNGGKSIWDNYESVVDIMNKNK